MTNTTDTTEAVRSVTLVTGASRPVERTWPAGDYECPWCNSPVFSREGWESAPERGEYPGYEQEAFDLSLCPNPACPANPRATVASVEATLERWRVAREERKAHERRMAAMDRRRQEEDVELGRRWTEVHEEAKRRGACVTCLLRSSWQWGDPRYVVHRTADFHKGRR